MQNIKQEKEEVRANAKVATVLGLIPASSDTVKSEGAEKTALIKVVEKSMKSSFITFIRMQLHTGAEHFGNVIFRYSELTSQYHFDTSIDVNRT